MQLETYDYDWNGNRISKVVNDGVSNRSTAYTFDRVDRLLTEMNPDERLEDTLDANGNRTQRLIKNGAGVLQSTLKYTNNARDQVLQIETRNAANALMAMETYQYDAEGNRISRILAGTTTSYVYDVRGRQVRAGAVLYELNDGGVRLAEVQGSNRTERVFDGLKLKNIKPVMRAD